MDRPIFTTLLTNLPNWHVTNKSDGKAGRKKRTPISLFFKKNVIKNVTINNVRYQQPKTILEIQEHTVM